MKIVSLVPSITELLHDLGLGDEVVGITRFCVHPREWHKSKQRIGGTKNIDVEKIISLQPDLIIANKEENVKEQVEQLCAFKTLVTDVNDVDEALEMIGTIGALTCRAFEAAALGANIQKAFEKHTPGKQRTAAYLIWQDPYMTVGGGTFIHSMMGQAGFRNVFGDECRYPVVSVEAIQKAQPEYLLLSSEPYPFSEKHVAGWQTHLPATKIELVDGEMFSWYGSRMLKAPAYFNEL